jgi:Protein kinase domain
VDALQPGDPRRVGRYRLLKRLGTGGMGRVYLGQSLSGRLVAVKVIRPELADDPDFRQRFAQEVTAARRVSGIFTAPVVDADPDGARPWMVTAFVSGPSLADAVSSQGPLPTESVFTLAAGLAEGLGAVHAAGVVHRDLKPSNVLLASDGPRIIDFGISRAADATALTRGGRVVGSPGFMSPEQAEGRHVGPETDIFSLGGVLTYAATGEPPFGAGSPSALLYRVVYGAAATGHVPAELRSLVERCLAKNPAARPTTDELLAELGFAEPAEDWLTWERPAVVPAVSLHATELDQRPGAETGPQAGRLHEDEDYREDGFREDGFREDGFREDGFREDGFREDEDYLADADRRAAARHGASATTVLRAEPARADPRLRRALVIGLAAAAVLAVAGAVAVGVDVASGHQHNQRGAQGSSADAHQASGASAPASQAQTRPAAGHPRAVIEAYYAAVNNHDWQEAWNLGGQNLASSYQALVAGYADTEEDVIRAIRVAGDHVVVRLRAYEISGALQIYLLNYIVKDGVIVSGTERLIAVLS